MTKKIIACVLVVFFAGLFFACSKRPAPKEEPLNLVSLDHDWKQVTKGEPFPWDSIDGFFPNKEHKYGFDRHPSPKKDSTGDSIVYISVLDGDSGKVALKINQDFGSTLKLYDYYICEPAYPYDTIATIDNSVKELSYSFTTKNKEKMIALCGKSETGIRRVQELSINPYKWNDGYNFYAYILGDKKDTSARHQLLNSTNFWDYFNEAFSQAVVKHGDLFGEFKTIDRGYIFTREKGIYEESDNCVNNSVIKEAINEINSRAESGGTRRNIIQVGYPTKLFLPLKYDKNNNIQICGTPNYDPTDPNLFNLELETLPSSKCSKKIEAFVKRDKDRNVWRLEYKDGRQGEDATKSNVDTDCMVFTDTSKGTYVDEVGYGVAGITLHYEKASIVIQIWKEDFTAVIALHELGHTMRLADLNDNPLSIVSYEVEENNLMHYSTISSDYKLRKRGVAHKDTNVKRKEYQWDCLQNVDEACINPKRGPDLP